jgi:general L-amino acid transport system permease protein
LKREASAERLTAIPLWRDARHRPILIQAGAALAVALAAAVIVWQVTASIEEHGLRTGFGFLTQRGGFKIEPSLIPFTEKSSFARAFLVGLLNTLLVAALAIPLATLIGTALGIASLSKSWAASRAAHLYVEMIRSIPPLIQLFFWYFLLLHALPPPRQSLSFLGAALNNRGLQLPFPASQELHLWLAGGFATGCAAALLARRRRLAAFALLLAGPALALIIAGLVEGFDVPVLRGFNYAGGALLTPEFTALVMALCIYQAAYIAETVRSGIESVGRGQSEAARSLGLGAGATLRLVTLPQAMAAMLPPLATTYVNTVKGSTLAAAIAYPDLVSVFAGTVLNLTGQAIEIMLVTGSVYLVISFAIATLLGSHEARLLRRRA